MDEREAYIALNMMEKVGPVGVRALVQHLGSARAIFDADEARLSQAPGITRDTVRSVLEQRHAVDWQGELAKAGASGIRLVTAVDEEYPKPLLEIHDPPLALYVRGSFASRDRHAIGIVGTRRPTHYGLDCAAGLAQQLSQAGFTIVSGLAEGVDTAAHRGALKAKGRTIAVIGSGLECLYPPSNAKLADEIAAGQGAVLSEFALARQPDRTTFPIRNRIVSGLSMGLLVIEADMKSGAMITANQALEQGRSVFALPGRVDNPMARGTNNLIQNGARLVTCVEDILKEFEFLIPPQGQGPRESVPRPRLTEDEERLVGLLAGGEKDVDSLIRESGFKASAVSSMLIGLEMKRAVRMLPGRMVERIGS